MAQRLVDWLWFGNVWVSLAAAALCLASGRALGVAVPAPVAALSFCGTFSVYTIDRLRDLARDRETSPLRTAFVQARRGPLGVAAALSLAAAAGLGVALGPPVVLVCAAVLALGLLHRRLKRFALAKPVYLTLSWTAVAVGLPLAAAQGARSAVGGAGPGAVALVVAGTVLANVILSNLRDGEGLAVRLGRRRALALACVPLAAAAAVAALGPPALRALAWLPATTALAVALFRPGERYGMGVVDGALLLGALLALA
jgi:hypothetical protein